VRSQGKDYLKATIRTGKSSKRKKKEEIEAQTNEWWEPKDHEGGEWKRPYIKPM